MRFTVKPDRIDLKIRSKVRREKLRNHRVTEVELNHVETRIFWEDLIEDGKFPGDPTSDEQFAAFVALRDFDYEDTIVKLNVEET